MVRRAVLGQVQVAVVYENVTDGITHGPSRSTSNIAALLRDVRADIVFRAFWRWAPVPNSPEDIPQPLMGFLAERAGVALAQLPALIRASGYHYAQLAATIAGLKRELPAVVFVGAVPAQKLTRVVCNEMTGEVLDAEEMWGIALDPEKWSIQRDGEPVTKEAFQRWFGGTHQWVRPGEAYDWRTVQAYFPDVTNPRFQELLVSWAGKQIDCGADAIWIDGLPQTSFLYQWTRDPHHPMIADLFAASQKIVDDIQAYGRSMGRHIWVGMWAFPLGLVEGLPYAPPNVDFVTFTPWDQEVLDRQLDSSKWERQIARARAVYGDIPRFAFIDWSFDRSPLVVFSQQLNDPQRRRVLTAFDEAFEQLGVTFVYPLRGGYIGGGPVTTKLAFGKYRTYDSLAPEFATYEIIKERAQVKSAARGEQP